MQAKVRIKSLLKILILLRCVHAVLTKTFFQADEFWQSLEPAHYMAFGYGELTWEWKFGLRSYAFPLIFQIGYVFVKYTARFSGLIVQIAVDWVTLVVENVLSQYKLAWEMLSEMQKFPAETQDFIEYYGVLYVPKIIMGTLAGTGEYFCILFVLKIYKIIYDKNDDKKEDDSSFVVSLTLLATCTNFFNCFVISRTFNNSFEMILTCIALYYWDWTCGGQIESPDFMKSLLIGMFACLQRPTNACIWVILGSFIGFNLIASKQWAKLVKLCQKVVLSFIMAGSLNMMIDFYFYGYLTIPVLKFIKFNSTSSLSKFYGVSPWHFHILQSLPIISGYTLPILLHSMVTPLTTKRFSSILSNPIFQMKSVVILNILMFSLIPHKEFRFIYPLQPVFILLSVLDLLWIEKRYTSKTSTIGSYIKKIGTFFWILPTLSVIIALLLNTIHESGVISVINYLHSIESIDSIGFLMPCHSTPWQSHFHRNDVRDMWAISCEPPLHLLNDPDADQKLKSYMDESDYLYEDIKKFIHMNFPPVFRKDLRSPGAEYKYEWPEYLVIFQNMDDSFMNDFLEESNYYKDVSFFNTLSHWDHRRSGDVVVYHKMVWR